MLKLLISLEVLWAMWMLPMEQLPGFTRARSYHHSVLSW